jgi:hypothetical protein
MQFRTYCTRALRACNPHGGFAERQAITDWGEGVRGRKDDMAYMSEVAAP